MKSTAILMRAVLLLIFIMLWVQVAEAQTVAQNERTIFTIDINESGNALWTAEKIKPLTTQSEISEWESILKDNATHENNMIAEFNKINVSLSSAQNYSNRSMSIENFNTTYEIDKTLPNAFVKIRFSFEWKNFSQVNSSKIFIGDAFSEGRIPSPDNVLIIQIPSGYHVLNASPNFDKSDGNRLIWDGTLYRSFSKGEPSLVLSKEIIAEEPVPNMMFIIALVILVSGGLFIFWIKRRPTATQENGHAESNLPRSSVSEIQKENKEPVANGINEINATQTEISENLSEEADDLNPDKFVMTPDLEREILSDEEMIEQYLVKFGGQAYQTEIVKESGLSKSKISIVLAKMKDEGRILKIRKGKENIIRLAPKK